MTAGFQALTDSGFIQIDSEVGMPNYQLRQKIVQGCWQANLLVYYNNVGTNFYINGVWTTTFTFNAVTPMVAFSCDSGAYIAPVKWTVNGNSFSVDVISTGPCNITAYVFDQAWNAESGNNFGMKVWNGAGQLIADATVPFARPMSKLGGNLQFADGSTGWYAGGGQEPPHGVFGQWGFGVGQVAVACVSPAWQYAVGTGCWVSCFNTSGGTVTGLFAGFGDTGGGNNNYVGFKESLHWDFVAMDVSNY